MIDFQHKLPALNIEERHNGTYNNMEWGFPSVLTTTDSKLGCFIRALRNSIKDESNVMFMDNKVLYCLKPWIRDHVHILKAAKHFEHELLSFYDFIVENQREDGQFYELIKQYDDYHWKMVNEDCYKMYEEDNIALVRLELEADIEYLVVEGAMYIYHVFGDNEWLKKTLPALEKGIEYMVSSEKRFDKEHGLVKRNFTIDTWDFTYKVNNSIDRRIHKDSPMSIMHGDNSGVYQAMNQLAWFNRRLGNEEKALYWEKKAEVLKENIFKYLWNGTHFIHQLHLNHSGADDKENVRLSLSNTYDMNRGLMTTEQCRKVIEEYMRRKDTTEFFAEWFSIDPPYDCTDFEGYKPGRYVNGAISPFTAGELAKAAFNNGYEDYGWDIISRFMKLVERDGVPFFLYDIDSKPQPEGGPSAWGSAAFLSAVDEGLAGIVDLDVNYNEMKFSPKFVVTHYEELRYITGYHINKTVIDVKFIVKENGMRYDLSTPSKKIDAHILLPKGKTCSKLLLNGKETAFTLSTVGESDYVDLTIENNCEKTLSFEILF